MQRFLIIILLASTTLMSGCAVLTKSQVESVNNFATLANQGAEYPQKAINSMIDLEFDNKVSLRSIIPEEEPLTHDVLSKFYTQKQEQEKQASRIKSGIAVIGAYALALKRLSSPDFAKSAGSASEALGKSFDKLTDEINGRAHTTIPKVGSALNQALKEGTSRYISVKQTKAIRTYVQKGDSLIDAVLTDAESFLQGHVSAVNENSRKEVSRYTNLLLNGIPNPSYDRYQLAVGSFYGIYKIDQVEKLNQQAIIGLRQIRLAHREIKNQLLTKQKLTDVGQELFHLYETVQDLQATFKEIKF